MILYSETVRHGLLLVYRKYEYSFSEWHNNELCVCDVFMYQHNHVICSAY